MSADLSSPVISGRGVEAVAAEEVVALETVELERYVEGLEIGQGAMGRVVLVADRRLRRVVAKKEVTGPWERLLLREAWILAQLEHPGIVPVHDIGRTDDGRLFFVMRAVSGRDLSLVLAERAGERDRRLALLRNVLQVAEAVASAHNRGVVHRDLKPANVLLGPFGETIVVDWGLAALVERAAEPIEPTARAEIQALDGALGDRPIGTPRYMSPEQAAGLPADCRSDVYALGAILYEVATGSAIVGPQGAGATLASVRRGDIRKAGAAGSEVPPELAAIVDRALAFDPAARYPDAKHLAEDLARYLDGRRVAAYQYHALDHLRRFVAAWRAPLIIGAAALVAFAVFVVYAFVRIDAERDGAVTALARSDQALARTLTAHALSLAAEGALPEAEVLAARAYATSRDPEALGVLLAQGRSLRPALVRTLPVPRCRDLSISSDGRDLLCVDPERIALYATGSPTPRWEVALDNRGAAFAGREIIVARAPHGLLRLAADSGSALGELDDHEVNPPPLRRLDGDGVYFQGATHLVGLAGDQLDGWAPCRENFIATSSARGDADWAVICRDGALVIGTWQGGPRDVHPTPFFGFQQEASQLTWLADGRLVVGTEEGRVAFLDPASGAILGPRAPVVDGRVGLFAPSADDRFVLVGAERGGLTVIDGASLVRRATLPLLVGRRSRFVGDALWAFTPDGVRVLSVALGPVAVVELAGGISGIAAHPNGRDIAVAHGTSATVVDIDRGVLRPIGSWTYNVVRAIAYDARGDHVLVASLEDSSVHRYGSLDLAERDRVAATAVRRVAGLASGESLIDIYNDVRAISASGQRILIAERTTDLAVSWDGRFGASATEQGGILYLLRGDPLRAERVAKDPGALAVAPFPDGGGLYAAHAGVVIAWSASGIAFAFYPAPEVELIEVAASGDGRWLAAGARDGTVILWRVGTAERVAVFRDHRDRATALAFEPGPGPPAWLASGAWDGTLRIRDLRGIERAPAELEALQRATWGLDATAVLAAATR